MVLGCDAVVAAVNFFLDNQSFGERLTAIAMVMMVIGYLVWPLVQ